jgi:hypothetical protein
MGGFLKQLVNVESRLLGNSRRGIFIDDVIVLFKSLSLSLEGIDSILQRLLS